MDVQTVWQNYQIFMPRLSHFAPDVAGAIASTLAVASEAASVDIVWSTYQDFMRRVSHYPPAVAGVIASDLTAASYGGGGGGGQQRPSWFNGNGSYAAQGGEAQGDVLATFTVPPQNLPNEPLWWVTLGTGEGSVFFVNNGPMGTPSGQVICQFDNRGTWEGIAVWNLTATSFPAPNTVFRAGQSASLTPGAYYAHHYDPAVDTAGLRFRVIANQSPTAPCTLTVGIKGEIVFYDNPAPPGSPPGGQPPDLSEYVLKAGDTMTGALMVKHDPEAHLDLVGDQLCGFALGRAVGGVDQARWILGCTHFTQAGYPFGLYFARMSADGTAIQDFPFSIERGNGHCHMGDIEIYGAKTQNVVPRTDDELVCKSYVESLLAPLLERIAELEAQLADK